MSRYPVQDFIAKHFPFSYVIYAKRQYGYSWTTLLTEWKLAKAEAGTRKTFTDRPITRAVAFYSRLAERGFEESAQYACVEGCCTIIWHPTRGNTGGMGRPGCRCDGMKDPRDLKRGPLGRAGWM